MSLYLDTEKGEVVQQLPDRRARVKIPKRSNCQGCGHRSFCDPFGSEHMLLNVDNSLQAGTGQQVEVAFQAEKQGKAILILYLIPLFALLLGAILGNSLNPLGHRDASASVCSIGFTAITFAGIWYYTRKKAAASPAAQPRVIKILE